MAMDLRLLLGDQKKSRMEGLRQSLQIADRVLTGKDMKVEFVEEWNGYPAWSLDREIIINLAKTPDPLTDEGMATILGLNYHEVAHVVYSPTDLNNLMSAYQDSNGGRFTHKNFRKAYTVLEENRIETLYCNRYPRLKKWFTYPVIEVLVKNSENWDTAFLTTHGRRYLPREIRKNFRDIYERSHGKEITDKLADLIDRYRYLPIKKKSSMAEAASIINEAATLLPADFENSSHSGPPSGTGGGVREEEKDADNAKQEEEQQDQQEKELEREEQEQKEKKDEEQRGQEDQKNQEEEEEGDDGESGDERSDDGPDDSEDGEREEDVPDSGDEDSGRGGQDPEEQGEDSSESGSGDDPEDEHGGEDAPVAGEGDSGESGDYEEGSGDGGSDSPSGEKQGSQESLTAGNGASDDSGDSPPTQEVDYSELRNALGEILKDVLSDKEAQEELKGIQAAMDDPRMLGSTLKKPRTTTQQVTPDMLANSSAVSDQLRQIWTRMEAGWEYGVSEGSRIDMNRAAMAQDADDYESMYDDWQMGQQEDSRIAAVICADNSLSTGTRISHVWGSPTVVQVISRNVWELKYALQEIEATTTVLNFNTSCGTVYNREDMVTAAEYEELHASGGTDPTDAFEEARRILTFTEEPKKLLVVITDGDWFGWDDGTEYRRTMSTLNHLGSMGVVRVAILVNGYERFKYRDGFDVVAVTRGEILEPMASAVIHLMEGGTE